jgi:hypothetical protein
MVTKDLAESFIADFYSRTVPFIKMFVGRNIDEASILDHFLSMRVAIAASKEILAEPNGQYMLAMTVNLLIRFCPNLTLFIPETVPRTARIPLLNEVAMAESLLRLAQAINPYASITINPSKSSKYHSTIGIANTAKHIRPTISINSDGWLSFVDTNGNSLQWASKNNNPIGAYDAACLGVAEVFKELLYRLVKMETPPTQRIGNLTFSALDYAFTKGPVINPPLPSFVQLGSLHFVSMGALNSAALYTLCSLPDAEGHLTLVEPQSWEVSNLNRCLILTAPHALAGTSKVELAREIGSMHIGTVKVAESDYRTYRARNAGQMDLALVGVDNNESRWDVQMDKPRVLICGGTERAQVTVSRHEDTEKACAGCIYSAGTVLESSQIQPVPTISFVSGLSGVLIAGEVLKSRVAELSKYKLDVLLDLESLRASTIEVRNPPRSARCKCNCSGCKMIA